MNAAFTAVLSEPGTLFQKTNLSALNVMDRGFVHSRVCVFQGLCLERAPFYTLPMGSLPDRRELNSADFKTLQYGLSQAVE